MAADRPRARWWGLLLALLASTVSADTGSLTIDKARQRQMALRTTRIVPVGVTHWIAARVVPLPAGLERISAPQAGTLDAPAGGFAPPGSRISAGQVLGWLRPRLSLPEQQDLAVQQAAAARDVTVGRLQLDRFGIRDTPQFDVQLPTPTALVIGDYRTAVGRQQAYATALAARVALRAHHDGVVIARHAQTGAVLQGGEPLFELAASGTLALDAASSDDAPDWSAIHDGRRADGQPLRLQLQATSDDPLRRRHTALFALTQGSAPVVAGATVWLRQSTAAFTGVSMIEARLPRLALCSEGDARWVWLHRGGEYFERLPVTIAPGDDGADLDLRLRAAWPAAARVVTQGARALCAAGGPA